MELLAALAFVGLSPPALADSYGAIAYSPSTGANGASWSYGDVSTALIAAYGACGQADCATIVYVDNGCAALAVGSNGGRGWAWNGDVALAEAAALQQCSNQSPSCQVVRWVCST